MSTPSWIVLASVCAGSTCAKRARSSSASTRRCIRSACARCHRSVRSLTERFLKLSYSAASRRYLSFMSASSPSRRTTASSDGSISAPDSEPAGQEGDDVAERGVALRVVQHLVIHLWIPADQHGAFQAVGEGARQVRIDHTVLARE